MKNKKAELTRLFQQLSNGKRCYFCPRPAQASHHIIYKSQSKILRYNPLNAMPVCIEHHENAHEIGVNAVLNLIPVHIKDYLETYKNMDFKEFLILRGYNEKEFLKEMESRLKLELNK